MWARGCYPSPAGSTHSMTSIDRVLSGEELLAIQGFGWDLQALAPDPLQWSGKQKTDMAGNAFAAVCTMPLLTAWIACSPLHTIFDTERELADIRIADGGDDDRDGGDEEGEESEALPASASEDASDDVSDDSEE
jgi:hypothetical protein